MRRHHALFVAAFVAALVVSAGCEQALPGVSVSGLSSFKPTLTSPLVDPKTGTVGVPGSPVDIGQVTFDLEALGPDGKRWDKACTVDQDCCPAGMDCSAPTQQVACGADAKGSHPVCQQGACAYDLDVFLSFGGNKVGQVSACGTNTDVVPVRRVHLCGGFAKDITVKLVKAFGAATIWIEEATTTALGTSPVIYFAEPTIPDVQTPLDPQASTATWCSPWNGRHVILDHASIDPVSKQRGDLVVTSVFGSAYVVADTGANFDPVGGKYGYNHMYVFTFGRPDFNIVPGRQMKQVSGNVSKFNGFTELNFPIEDYDYQSPLVPLPAIYELQKSDRGQSARLLRMAASTVKVHGVVCPIDTTADSWLKFNQFVLDLGEPSVCDAFSSFAVELPSKVFGGFDPMALAGKKREIAITGMLRNSSGQNEACKGIKDAPGQVDCRTDAECIAARSDPSIVPACQIALAASSVHCVEGTCRRGVYNFWTVVPRNPSDITTN